MVKRRAMAGTPAGNRPCPHCPHALVRHTGLGRSACSGVAWAPAPTAFAPDRTIPGPCNCPGFYAEEGIQGALSVQL